MGSKEVGSQPAEQGQPEMGNVGNLGPQRARGSPGAGTGRLLAPPPGSPPRTPPDNQPSVGTTAALWGGRWGPMVPRHLIPCGCSKVILLFFPGMQARVQGVDRSPLLTCRARAAVSTQQAAKQTEKPRRRRTLRPRSSTTNTCKGGGTGQAGRSRRPAREGGAYLCLQRPSQEAPTLPLLKGHL